MSMKYAVRQTGDITVFDLSGRLSLGEAIAFGPGSGLVLHDVVREQLKEGHKQILLNLREVTYIDSSGLGDLASSMTTVQNQGGQLRMCNATARVNDLLRLTHLDSVLNLDKDEATALHAFSQKKDSVV